MILHPKLNTRLWHIPHDMSETLMKWRNSPEIYKWCRQNDLLTEENHNNWFKNHQTDSKIKMYLIRTKDSTPVGVCGLTDIDLINLRAEFSLYIAPEYQGNGLGKDALKLLLWHSFKSYPLNIIWGETFATNPAINAFEDIGFKKEGVRRDFYWRDGSYLDAILLSIKHHELKI
jgi:UDP-4-amino-4,6-dideoxy-N-acetyl-beta-L-altrosamine N-acetyltransferase